MFLLTFLELIVGRFSNYSKQVVLLLYQTFLDKLLLFILLHSSFKISWFLH
jgi:hypothetical protein